MINALYYTTEIAVEVSLNALIEMIRNELHANFENYQGRLDDDDWARQLEEYLTLGEYRNNSLVDLMPTLLANIFNVNILITNREYGPLYAGGEHVIIRPEFGVPPAIGLVVLVYDGAALHYDALVPPMRK